MSRRTCFAMLLGVLLFAACSERSEQAPACTGIVTLAPHLTETVFALGQGDRVVGVGNFCDYPPEIERLPRAGGYIDPDLEKLTMLSPEMLIVPGKHGKVSEYAAMRHLPVLNVHMDSLATIDSGIAQIGEALGCPDKATALREEIAAKIAAVREAVNGLPRPKVLIVTTRADHDLNNLYTTGGGSFVSELVDCAGGDNVFANATTPYLEASKESVVMKAPEVILEFHAGEKLDDVERKRFVEDWGRLPTLPAVRQHRIYPIEQSHALRPGPRVGEIARILARLLHPDAVLPES